MKRICLYLICISCLLCPLTWAGELKESDVIGMVANLSESRPVLQNLREPKTNYSSPGLYQQNGKWFYWNGKESRYLTESETAKLVPPSAHPTPRDEVDRILYILKPKKSETFIDYGCGADARFLIEAARQYGCRSIGIEIDPIRAAFARKVVKAAGVENKVQIIEADSTKVSIPADVGVAFLYLETLKKLTDEIRKLDRFASHIHRPPGLRVTKDGNAWVWRKQQQATRVSGTHKATYGFRTFSRGAAWGGSIYCSPVCNSRYCRMCNSIRRQLGR